MLETSNEFYNLNCFSHQYTSLFLKWKKIFFVKIRPVWPPYIVILCMAYTCYMDFSSSGEPFDDDTLLLSDEHCKTTEWSEWSECTATCGIGFMTRTRHFLKRSGFKKCKHISIFEKKKCMEPPCKATQVEKVKLKNNWNPYAFKKVSSQQLRHLWKVN